MMMVTRKSKPIVLLSYNLSQTKLKQISQCTLFSTAGDSTVSEFFLSVVLGYLNIFVSFVSYTQFLI